MAIYETGTATGPSDLLTKLIAFATTNGWTSNTPSYALSGTYSRSGTTGLVTVSGLTGHKFVVGETVAANITSGGATSGNFVVLSTPTTSSLTYQDAVGTASGNVTLTSTHGRILSKGGKYFAVGYLGSDFVVAGATGYSASSHWLSQTGASTNQPRSNEMAGPYQAYHFFTGSPDYIHVVVEATAGIYKHLQIGEIVKSGSFTGGEYACACYWHMPVVSASQTPNHPDSTYHSTLFDTRPAAYQITYRSIIRADIDSKTNNWMVFRDASTWGGNNARGVVRGTTEGILESLHERSPSEFNQITPLLPILICAERPLNMTSPLGYVPDMRYVNMTNITPGELLTIGTDEWLCFPLIQKTATWNNSSSAIPSSGTYGLAFKRN